MNNQIINTFLSFVKDTYDIEDIDPTQSIHSILDSMSILSVLIKFEKLGYITKYINVSELTTIDDMIDRISKCEQLKV